MLKENEEKAKNIWFTIFLNVSNQIHDAALVNILSSVIFCELFSKIYTLKKGEATHIFIYICRYISINISTYNKYLFLKFKGSVKFNIYLK